MLFLFSAWIEWPVSVEVFTLVAYSHFLFLNSIHSTVNSWADKARNLCPSWECNLKWWTEPQKSLIVSPYYNFFLLNSVMHWWKSFTCSWHLRQSLLSAMQNWKEEVDQHYVTIKLSAVLKNATLMITVHRCYFVHSPFWINSLFLAIILVLEMFYYFLLFLSKPVNKP